MNKLTKNIFTAALLFLLVSLGACAFLLFQIKTVGAELESYIAAVNERDAEEANYLPVNRRAQETVTERAELAKAFFTDEGDSIGFIDDIESFAAEVGISLVTEGLDKKTPEGDTTEYITIAFVYTGDKNQVRTFTEYLEEVPYHSYIESLNLTKRSGGIWEGRVMLYITLLPS